MSHTQPATFDAIGPPLRVRDIATRLGISKKKIMADAKRGELELLWVKCGQRRMATVDRSIANRYIRRLTESGT